MKNIVITLIFIIVISCKNDYPIPDYSLLSLEYITHNSVIIKYSDKNNTNGFYSGITLFANTVLNDTGIFIKNIYDTYNRIYYVNLTDLKPNCSYSFSFRYYNQEKFFKQYDTINFYTKSIQTIIDERDGKVYNIGQIGNQWWTFQNIAFNHGSSVFPPDSLISYGSYYTYEEALNACPDGWHLPTDEEWIELERYIEIPEDQLFDTSSGRGFNEIRSLVMRNNYMSLGDIEDYWMVNNEYGFSVIFGGYFSKDTFSFDNYGLPLDFGAGAYYWTSTLNSLYNKNAFVRNIKEMYDNELKENVFKTGRFDLNKNYRLNVRCITNI